MSELDLLEINNTKEASKTSNLSETALSLIVQRPSLLKALAHVQTIVEKRNIIPILSNVKLVTLDGQLQLTATDMDLAVSENIPAEVTLHGALTVSAHTLYDIVRKLPDELDIELKTSVEGKLNINAGNCKFSLPFLPADDFPVMDEGEMSHEFVVNTDDLIHLIDKNKFSISTEETRYSLNGIYFHTVESEGKSVLRAAATDGHRLSRVELPLPVNAGGMPGIIVPRKAVFEIRKVVENNSKEVKISLSKAKIKFQYEDITLISKLVDGSFPDYEHLIPQDNKRVMQVETDNFSKAVDRVSTVTFEKIRAIKFSLTNELLTLSASGESNGYAQEELMVNYKDSDLEVGFNSRYLLDVMSVVKGKMVEFRFSNDGYLPAIIQDLDDDRALFVLMPMLV